jgi:uncharacterized protein YsxB (DUF464 family)
MVNVRFLKEDDRLIAFDISGHAGFDDQGFDVVCSAISAMSITIANGIIEVLNIDAACEVRDGFLSLTLKELSLEDIERCEVLMKTLLISLESMKVNYGDYINVTIEEV